MNSRYNRALIIALLPVAAASYYCIAYLDIDVARFVWRTLYASKKWQHLTLSLPDFLLILVICVSVTSHLLARYRSARFGADQLVVMFRMLAIVGPASYIAKSVLKFVFGRVNTRVWLGSPQEYGFHWFSGTGSHAGFPSGHMLVFTAFLAVLWRFFPRCRITCSGLLSGLALALIATDYHFVSDVIAGTYAGLVMEACVCRLDNFRK